MLLAYFMIYDLTYRSYFIPFIAFFGPDFSTPILSWPVRYHLLHLSYCGDLLVELLASWGGRMIYIYNYAWNCADLKRMLRCCFHFVSMSLYQNLLKQKNQWISSHPFFGFPVITFAKTSPPAISAGLWLSDMWHSATNCTVLVGGLEHVFPYIVNNDPNWRTHIFQRGRYTTDQCVSRRLLAFSEKVTSTRMDKKHNAALYFRQVSQGNQKVLACGSKQRKPKALL